MSLHLSGLITYKEIDMQCIDTQADTNQLVLIS